MEIRKISEIGFNGRDLKTGDIVKVFGINCSGQVKEMRVIDFEDRSVIEVICKTLQQGKLTHAEDFRFLLTKEVEFKKL